MFMPRRYRVWHSPPALHVNYAETVLKDFPAEMGGSGTVRPNNQNIAAIVGVIKNKMA